MAPVSDRNFKQWVDSMNKKIAALNEKKAHLDESQRATTEATEL